ncbi:MAG: ABC transporter ATP-binding protein [Ruminococcaceae bacterium]|nr:ABC transporter ATP-binding protein [Oscillospiraceae bacterium]
MIFGRHINRYYLRYLHLFLGGIAALLLVDIFQLKVPELYNLIVNGINDGAVMMDGELVPFDLNFLLDHICLPLMVIIILMVFGRFLWRICFFNAGIKVETDLRRRMFDHCKDLPQEYYQTNKVGNLMSLFTNDLETIQECIAFGVLELTDAVLLGGLAIFKMWRMNPLLTLLSLIPMALLLSVGLLVGKYMTMKWDARQEAFSELSDFAQENFSGISVVKAFVKEFLELMAFRRLNKKNEDANVEYTKISTLLHISVTLLVESVICIILGYGSYLVKQDIFNAGQLVEFIGYFTAIVWPIMAVSELIDMTSRGRASVNRVSELLDAPVTVRDREDVKSIGKLKGEITAKNLTFRYPGADYDALSDISFTIKAGESVGIVGKTGCGKTTLVDLLLRTYNVPDGVLFYDGHDVNAIPIREVRDSAAYVPQDNFLFSDTVQNNISFATVEHGADTDEETLKAVREAAELADVHENIMEFHEQYETVLGERGVTVSGGQKQRISIARALMKNAPILILDDSVSAVDTKTEKRILARLKENRAGMTTLLIEHRISTVEDMDRILFLEDGKLMDFGTHAELCERCEGYRNLVHLQKLDEEGGNSNA